jgi:hypothetical protein
MTNWKKILAFSTSPLKLNSVSTNSGDKEEEGFAFPTIR